MREHPVALYRVYTNGEREQRRVCETPTVSSVQMECTWVPNITEVKMRNRRASKHKRMRRITVVGGEKELHSVKTKQWSWKGRGQVMH